MGRVWVDFSLLAAALACVELQLTARNQEEVLDEGIVIPTVIYAADVDIGNQRVVLVPGTSHVRSYVYISERPHFPLSYHLEKSPSRRTNGTEVVVPSLSGYVSGTLCTDLLYLGGESLSEFRYAEVSGSGFGVLVMRT